MTRAEFEARVNYWRIRLGHTGLTHWRFDFDYDDDALEDRNGREADASVGVHETYDTAHWHVRPATLGMDPLTVDETIVHELLHVAMRNLNSVEHDILAEVGGRSMIILSERLEVEIESFVERLARAIVSTSAVVVL